MIHLVGVCDHDGCRERFEIVVKPTDFSGPGRVAPAMMMVEAWHELPSGWRVVGGGHSGGLLLCPRDHDEVPHP